MRGHNSPLSLLPALLLSAACGSDTASDDSAAPPFTTSTVTAGSGSPVAPSAPSAAGAPAAMSGSAMSAPATSTAGAQQPPAAAASPATNPVAPPDTTSAQPATDTGCEGFKLEGLMHSPGGEVLPNKCMPFHPTTNNPYAVRCVDAWPWYKTMFPGDEFCVLPPLPEMGIQYGVHPQGAKWYEQVSQGDMSGYDGLADEWLMDSGEEESANYETAATNPAQANFYRSYSRMRAGSHHMIVNSDSSKPGDERWYPVSEGGLIEGAAGLLGAIGLPGAQRPDENRPPSLEKPPEDAGHFRVLPANAKVTFNMHHFNATDRTILKEAWTNLWWEQDAKIPVQGMRGLDIGQVVTMAIPPGATQDLHYSWSITQPIRLVEAFGHRHAWTTNFSAWIEKPDGAEDIVYQSFNWLDEPTYRYDSVTKNPTPAPESLSDGGSSGIVTLNPGEKLHFNCHIEYTSERASTEGAPDPTAIGTLHFANEAFTGEMCILFGSTAEVEIGAPVVDTSALPAFATTD